MIGHQPPQPTRAEPADPTLDGQALYERFTQLLHIDREDSAFWRYQSSDIRTIWNTLAREHTRLVLNAAADHVQTAFRGSLDSGQRALLAATVDMLRDIA